jgi:ATP-dependent protease HslVU (ClpYQ) peptidase subunit
MTNRLDYVVVQEQHRIVVGADDEVWIGEPVCESNADEEFHP